MAISTETLLSGKFISRPDWLEKIEWAFVILGGIIFLIIIPRLGVLWSFIPIIVYLSIVLGTSAFLWTTKLYLTEWLTPVVIVTIVWGHLIYNNFARENRLKLQIKRQFEHYLAPEMVKKLQKDKYVYKGKLQPPKGQLSKKWKTRDQLLFNSTKFGDDMDRALQKEDKTWTYFANDIAYHAHKINRDFDILVNILGSDHAGYIKRITSAVKAISKNKINLICKVSQLVKLFKKGKPFKMSKRKGDYITVEDLIKEVGRDSVRFMMLNRSNDVELNFDFEKVTEKSRDNPVFYVQYAYARINSIFRALKLDIESDIKLVNEDFTLNQYEIEILKKISEWPRCVEISSFKFEPHRIPFYLYDLVTLFHSYWNLGKENKEFRFILKNNSLNNSRLLLLQALFIVIRNGMSILGVSTPKSM